LGLHETLLGKLLESHVREVVNSLSPSVSANVVVSDFNEGLEEDFEAVVRFGCIGGVIFTVDFFSNELIKRLFTVEEVSVLDVEVDIADGQGDQPAQK
jgi:hypothetical protein